MAKCYNSKLIFNNITKPTLSKPMSIGSGEVLKIQVDGTATSFSIKVTGSVASGMEYNELKIVKDIDDSENTSITSEGTYSCNVSGLFAVKFEVTSLSGGEIKLFAKSITIVEVSDDDNGGGSGSGGGGGNTYVLPAATSSTLGGIKVGANLSITNDGTLSVVGGTGDGDKTYVFTQSFATTEWNIEHRLNKYPSVVVVDSDLNQVIADVQYLDLNTVKIKFGQVFIGKAFLN